MKTITRVIIILIVVALIGAGGFYLWTHSAQASSNQLTVSGTLETTTVRISPEIGGVVVDLTAAEGQQVKASQPLIKINDATAQAQLAQAQAALQAAQANLAMLKSGATPEQLQEAQAGLDQADANLRMAQSSLNNMIGDNRMEDVQAAWAAVKMARTAYGAIQGSLTPDALEKVRTAQNNLNQANARSASISKDTREPNYVLSTFATATQESQGMMDASQAVLTLAENDKGVDSQLIEQTTVALAIAKNYLAAAQARQTALAADNRTPSDANDAATSSVTDAQKAQDDWQAAYDSIQNDPIGKRLTSAWDEVTRTQTALNNYVLAAARSGGASIETVLGQLDAATAARAMASAKQAEVKAGARQEQIDAAAAQVATAQAQVQLLQVQLAKYTIASPLDGVVLSRGIELGETAAPGATVFEIGDLKNLTLTVYLPEENFGTVKVGDQATVKVDAYPTRTFTAKVTRLANQAEFTPRNVQTIEGRKDTVYGLYLSLDNTDLALQPGMWADVTFTIK